LAAGFERASLRRALERVEKFLLCEAEADEDGLEVLAF